MFVWNTLGLKVEEGYGEVRGYGDHPEPYDRCNRNGCGY